MNTYIIGVVTSDRKNASTDANVYIEIYGSRETTGRVWLKNSFNNKYPFQQGAVDLFEIKCKDLGSIRKIRIGHDDKGLNPSWHLKEVKIESKLDGRVWFCESNQLFDRKEGDRKIERELIVIEQTAKKSVKFDPDYQPKQESPKKKLYYDDQEVVYKIAVVTSDIKSAGTDANVYVKLYGKYGETEKIVLKNSKTNRNKFEKGQTDVFEVAANDVGKIKRLIIGHDNSGLFSKSWHLKEVIIENSGDKFVFPCNKWFDKKLDDGLIERVLVPLEEIVDKSDRAHNFIGNLVDYDVLVKTSDILGAGTDSNVQIKIYGEYRKSEFIDLERSLSHKNKFEKGNTDKFRIREEFFGELTKIKIKRDNKGISPDWHLNEVIIESADLGRRWVFPCNKWVEKNETGLYQIELVPLNNKDTITDSDLKTYIIDVFTGDLPKSGTDANVYITLFGEDAESSEFHLNNSKTHMNKFERNHIDSFKFETKDLGDLIGIRVRHDNTGSYPSWFLDRVEITDKKKVYEFIAEKWFSIGRDDGKIDRIIKEKNYKNNKKSSKQHRKKDKKDTKKKEINPTKIEFYKQVKYYYVKVYTGGKQNLAGTDLHASIKMFGDNCESKVFHLSETKSNEVKFMRNQIDLFELECDQDLGTLYAIEIKFCDCRSRSNDLDLVKIEITDNMYSYTFDYNKAISLRDPDEVKYVKKILLETNAQFF